MLYIISSKDNLIRHTTVANDMDQATEQMAAHFRYGSWAAMLEDLGYMGNDFDVVTVSADPVTRRPSATAERRAIKGQLATTMLNAVRHLARQGNRGRAG